MSDYSSRSPRDRRDHDRHSRHRSNSHRRENGERNRERSGRPRGHGGFKWKDKHRRDPDPRDESRRHLERGYRNRSRSPRNRRGQAPSFEPNPSSRADDATTKLESATKDKLGCDAEKDQPRRHAPAIPATQESGEPMIIVHVNDRLGTRAAIPCLASDPIRLFKAQVAARIGRKPHEILLKRQGERPFKDQLTLEDYGVSNGVQIDLEIDTGE